MPLSLSLLSSVPAHESALVNDLCALTARLACLLQPASVPPPGPAVGVVRFVGLSALIFPVNLLDDRQSHVVAFLFSFTVSHES